MRALLSFALALTFACDLALPWSHAAEANPASAQQITADVVIAGGSTAALAAAFSAAEEGATVALLEPTDWIGGQLTASAVPAVDEAWHTVEGADGPSGEKSVRVDVAAIARDPRNMTPFFRDALKEIGNPGRGWVSRFCFEPKKILADSLEPRAKELSERLTIYRNTVVKRVEMSADGQRIVALEAITRTPRAGLPAAGYDVLPSQDLPRWYSAKDDERFTKQTIKFTAPVFIDATEWGELLVLTGAPYLQGVDREERPEVVNDQLGQAIVYCLVQRIAADPQEATGEDVDLEGMGYGGYQDRADAWEKIWTYRRILSTAEEPRVGDLCLQNWGYSESVGDGGNDYPFGYFLVSMKDAAAERADWQGGVNREVLAGAEQRALAWHEWFRRQAPKPFDPDQIVLAPEVLGTAHGIAKQPYIRDTRRSVGLEGFRLTLADLTADGDATAQTGTAFPDTIALGAYAADIHPLVGYKYPDFVLENHPTLPFCIPFRALTNQKVGNLLVAGKTMAQTFLANSATRLHPIEWSTGTAAGVAAARMSAHAETTADILADIEPLRAAVKKHTPVEWTIDAKTAGRAK